MVDEAGNKVDILEDLIRLEGDMNSYLSETTLLLNDIKELEQDKEQCLEDFNAVIPKIILELRKKRLEE